MKENKYDNDNFFEQYSKMSRSVLGLSGAGEWHALRELFPDFNGKRVLDLGCGYGWHCKYAVEHGAEYVLGIDLSEKMIKEARAKNSDQKIEYKIKAIEDFDYKEQQGQKQFDLVLSSLAFHYIASFEEICKKVNESLKEGGSFIFSVEHPIFTAQGKQQWCIEENGKIQYWPVDNYFYEGIRHANFLGEDVLKYHRTLTTYLQNLLSNGFEIVALVEPQPQAEMIDKIDGMRDEMRRPMMLVLSAIKRKNV